MTDLLITLGLAALPAAVLLAWIFRHDRARPEPLGAISRALLFGLLASLPAILLEPLVDRLGAGLPGPLRAAWRAFIVAALVEEGLKYLLVRRWIFRSPAFDEALDGIVYTMCVSLGFAFVENALYGYADRGVLLIRAFTAVPMHAAASGLMGWRLGLARFERDPARARHQARAGLALAVMIHGFYNFSLFLSPATVWLAPLVVVLAWLSLRSRIRQARDLDKARGLGSRDEEPQSRHGSEDPLS